MKFRSFVSALVVLVTVLAVTSVGGFYWLVSNSPLGVLQGGQAQVEAAMFVPSQAPLMVSLLVNPDRLEAFRMATVPLDRRKAARAEIAQIRQTLLSGTGLEYTEDIQPWLGDEITWAVTTPDVDRDRTNGLQPGYLLAIATNNARRSQEFLQLFWQQRAVAGTDLVFEQYAGVKLIYGRYRRSPASSKTALADAGQESDDAALTPALASAVVGDRFVLVANYPKVLRDAINNVQAVDLNLNHSDAYQRALQSLSSQQAGLVYSNLPELEHWLAGETPDTATAQTPLYSGLVLALNLDRQGLVGDTALLSAPGQSLPPAKPELAEPPEAAQFIPADSPLLATSRDLDALWQNVQAGLAGYDQPTALLGQVLGNWPRSPFALSTIAAPAGATGDVEPGFATGSASGSASASPVNWVTDDYAFGLLPRSDRPQPDWVFVAKQTPATQEAIAQLDAAMQAQGMSTGQIAIDDHDVTVWTTLSLNASSSRRSKRQPATLQAEVKGVRATVGRYEVLATSLDAIDRALHAPERSLVATDDFKAAIAPLGDRNDGYLYLDWPTVRTVLRQKLPAFRLIETLGQPLLKHVRSLTLTSYGSDSTLRRGALFVRLKES